MKLKLFLQELQGFFNLLSQPQLLSTINQELFADKIVSKLEKSFEVDFVERMN